MLQEARIRMAAIFTAFLVKEIMLIRCAKALHLNAQSTRIVWKDFETEEEVSVVTADTFPSIEAHVSALEKNVQETIASFQTTLDTIDLENPTHDICAVGGTLNQPTFSIDSLSFEDVYSPQCTDWDSHEVPSSIVHAVGVASIDGMIYKTGGWDGINPVKTVQRLTMDKQWEDLSDMKEARYAHGVVAVGENIYVIGGCKTSGCGSLGSQLNSMERYSSETGDWVTMSAMPVPLGWIGVAVHATPGNEMIYVAGGSTFGKTLMEFYSDQVFRYDLNMDMWTNMTSLPFRIRETAAAVLGNFLFVLGGYTRDKANTATSLNSVFRLDLSRGQISTWEAFPSLNMPRFKSSAIAYANTLIVAGGVTSNGKTQTVERFDELQNKWTFIGSMSTTRFAFGLVACEV